MENLPEHDIEHKLFTEHSNARLTFVVGLLLGAAIMTAGMVAFFVYTLSGGEVAVYDVEPLVIEDDVLAEPKTDVETTADTQIVVDETTNVFGAKEDYKVTLVRYIDYECRFCRKFFPELKSYYSKNKAKVRLIIKHYPLVQIHPQAKTAAIAAECAAEQDKLMKYSEALFDNQGTFSEELYIDLAEELNLDKTLFEVCLEDEAVVTKIENDTKEALDLGIKTQPNLIIWHNNDEMELIDGYVNEEYLESSISL